MLSTNGHVQTINPIDRTPPQNIEAEQALLGSLLIDGEAVHEVSGFLKPEHFYRLSNKWIYEAILSLHTHDTAVDLITLTDELRNRGQLEEIGAEPYLVGLVQLVPTSINTLHYGRIVEEMATRRQMIRMASDVAKAAYNVEGDLEEQIIETDAALIALRNGRTVDTPPRPREYALNYLNELDARRNRDGKMLGLPSPWTDLNKLLLGFISGKLYYVGARPGMGKSSMLIQLASHFTLTLGKRVFLWSGEMDTNQILDRIIAERKNIALTNVRRGEFTDQQYPHVLREGAIIGDSGLIIDETAGITPSKLRAACYREYMTAGLDAILVDYVGLMTPDRFLGNQNGEMTEISRSLLNLSRSLKVPVIAASQLSRAVEQRANKRPQLSDLRDSGSLEQDGYGIIFLYRDDYYNELSDTPNVTEAIVAKHREGPTGTVNLYWEKEQTAFRNYAGRNIVL